MMLADYKAAVEDSRRAVQLDKTFEKGYMRIAKCCVALGDTVAAEQAIKRILELNAKSTIVNAEIQSCKLLRVHEDTARTCYQSQDYRTAVYHADSALKIAPAGLKFKLLKAECLALLGRITVCQNHVFIFFSPVNVYILFNVIASQRFGRLLHANRLC